MVEGDPHSMQHKSRQSLTALTVIWATKCKWGSWLSSHLVISEFSRTTRVQNI